MKTKLAFWGFLTSIIFAYSCAQVGTLTGGDKDTKPPVMVGSKPFNKSVKFKGKKIIIAFDEYFELNNIQEEFVSSPPLAKMPEFIIRGRKLIIKLKSPLKDSTTYSFLFGNAVQDYHERNPAQNFRFVFSTGKSIDTMAVSGRVADAQTLMPSTQTFVMAYNTFEDSVPFKSRPTYICKTDSAGHFKLDYIKAGKYKLFALQDANTDLIFNMPEEKIAYLDSLIVPKASSKITIDTLKAGTELRHPETNQVIDTLSNDSIIISNRVRYTPDNIKLFSYQEDRLPQYITEFKRVERVKCSFIFNKPQQKVQWQCLSPKVNKTDFLEDISINKDTVLLWVLNDNVRKMDSLLFKFSYINKDSLGNNTTDTDSLLLIYSKPTAKNGEEIITKTDSLPSTYAEIKIGQPTLGIGKNFWVQSKYPILKLDTSKIKMYRTIDTLVADRKSQALLMAQRTDADKLFFVFKRPLVNEFRLQPVNFTAKNNWYTTKYSKNRDTITCKITATNLHKKDSLRILVHYDNNFYLNEIQHFKDTTWLSPIALELSQVIRNSPDTLYLKFNKPIGNSYKIGVEGEPYNSTNFKVLSSPENPTAKVLITNRNLRNKNQLKLTFNIFDKTDSLGNTTYFKDTVKANFIPIDTKLIKYQRYKKDKLFLVFNQAHNKKIQLKPNNFKALGSWFEQTRNTTNDTFQIKITNTDIAKLDTLKFTLAYTFFNKTKKDTTITIPLILPLKKIKKQRKKNRKQKKENLFNVEVNVPIPFSFYQDTIKMQKFFAKTSWQPEAKFKLELDSMAFINIFGNYNKEKSTKITVRKEDYYGHLNVNITNLSTVATPLFYNSTADSTTTTSNEKLPDGQVIVQLVNKKEQVVKELKITENKNISFSHIVPANYTLRLFYDKNNNGKYDQGDYLNHKQPERTLYYTDPIEVKAKWEAELEWSIFYTERKIPVKKKRKKKKR